MGSVKVALSKFVSSKFVLNKFLLSKSLLNKLLSRKAGVALLLLSSVASIQAWAEEGFPFGMEMTLEALPQPGSKRIPDLEIGDNGEVVLELWCKGGRGQFSVAGNTVVFVAGPMQDRACPPARAQADDELLAALSEATTWQRRGDSVAFIGSKALRFRLNTN
jgi:heat shock protein HslJ